jgi:hypothetical protein
MTDKDERRKRHEERMELAALDMENQQIDSSAETPHLRADIGHGTFAHGTVSTSPKILYHDRIWESIRNRHPQLESWEIEQLLEYVYGKSVFEAAPHFTSFSQERFEEVMNMSEEEIEDLLFGEEEDDV